MSAQQRPQLADLPPPPPHRTGWPWIEASTPLPNTMANGAPWPRISIVTPSYNQGQFIEETIRSVLLQGYPNLEYIVMDGGSTDQSVEIIRKYEPWIDYVRIGPDGGQSAAIAEGFRQATGEILAWINSDDYYLPGAFSRVAQFFGLHPTVIFAVGDVDSVTADGGLIRRNYAGRPNAFLTANLGKHSWPQQGGFWQRLAYKQIGGVDPTLKFCMDRDLFIRLTRYGPSRRISGPPLACFRNHETAKSSTILNVAQFESELLTKRHGNSKLKRFTWVLEMLWWLWSRPRYIRAGVHRRLHWEI
ncbi:glycosyltransferase [Candidatus Chloroploca sp. M-50]|uniref:Glycosyltransferase n=1 Tax=Candidatus Chloroploca mongolica TaxID=2528176 RepID=A0ABS4D8H2_9CHLR|nr:glycosyltransferase family 2 protein [Candidatus Chloroploca mongolica]MBP1465730.1 glycosyltransferase [Candidatus Chloroploca mongolica]